jgi:hypothetical protein
MSGESLEQFERRIDLIIAGFIINWNVIKPTLKTGDRYYPSVDETNKKNEEGKRADFNKRMNAYISMENEYLSIISGIFIYSYNNLEYLRIIYDKMLTEFSKPRGIFSDIDGHWFPMTRIEIEGQPQYTVDEYYKIKGQHPNDARNSLYNIFMHTYYTLQNPQSSSVETAGAGASSVETAGAGASSVETAGAGASVSYDEEKKSEIVSTTLSKENRNELKSLLSELDLDEDVSLDIGDSLMKQFSDEGLTNDAYNYFGGKFWADLIKNIKIINFIKLIRKMEWFNKLKEIHGNKNNTENFYNEIMGFILGKRKRDGEPDKPTGQKRARTNKKTGGYLNKDNYYHKYMKYKQKYITLRKQLSL